ncbi:MAG: hypothetical protein CMB80_02610 [Flammeovirgaceae bacterium]|nr:hypothetical protein [Flammeovirgaceae bacterium]
MFTDKIVQYVIEGNVTLAKTETEALLYTKLNDMLKLTTKEIVPEAYKEVVGMAGLVEKKKKKDDEELDPVGAEDNDVNNDGEVDNQDEYLNIRRGAVGKAIGKRKRNDKDDDE